MPQGQKKESGWQSTPSVSQVGASLALIKASSRAPKVVLCLSVNGPILIVTDGFELPHAINKLQVTHMLTLVSQDAINAITDPAERQLTQGLFNAILFYPARTAPPLARHVL